MTWWQKANSKQPKGWVIALMMLVLIAAIGAAIAQRGQKAEVATVTTGSIQHSLVFSSRVASVARAELASTMTARVEKVMVREGDIVKAGQLLISLDDDDLRAQLQQAQAALRTSNARLKSQYELSGTVATQGLAQSKANMDFALSDLERNRNLHSKGFIGDAKLQDVERAATSARTAYQQAAAQAAANTKGGSEVQAALSRSQEAQGAIDIVKAKLEQTSMVSPTDGRVISRTVEVGDVAQPGKKLLTIATTGETRLIAQIDEKNLRFLREGMRAIASADAFPDEKFDAELFYLSPSVDVTRGTVEARLRVIKAPTILRDDMTVSTEVIVAQKKEAVTVPRSAIREFGERKFVLVARAGKAEEQDVKLGIFSLLRAEIISGLSTGDQVILDEQIHAGQRIRPVATTAPARTQRAKTPDFPMPTQ